MLLQQDAPKYPNYTRPSCPFGTGFLYFPPPPSPLKKKEKKLDTKQTIVLYRGEFGCPNQVAQTGMSVLEEAMESHGWVIGLVALMGLD